MILAAMRCKLQTKKTKLRIWCLVFAYLRNDILLGRGVMLLRLCLIKETVWIIFRTLFHLCLPLDFFGQHDYDKSKVKLCKLFLTNSVFFLKKASVINSYLSLKKKVLNDYKSKKRAIKHNKYSARKIL